MVTIIEQNSSWAIYKDKSTENYDCPFCSLHFDDPNMRKHHILGHFIKKTCNNCDSELIQICDEWYSLHPCDQNEPEVDIEPPRINLFDVKMEDPLEIVDAFNVPLVNVKEEIKIEEIEDVQPVTSIDDETFVTHSDAYSESDQLTSKKKQEKTAPRKINRKPQHDLAKERKMSKHRLPRHPHRIQKNLECDICKIVMSTYYRMTMHMECHIPIEKRPRIGKCEKCNKTFITSAGMKQHMDNHRRNKCVLCNKDFRSGHLLRSHKKMMHGFITKHCNVHSHRVRRNLECDLCGVVIATFHSMVKHMESKHMPKEKRFLTCELCQKKVLTAAGLKIHMENHRIQAGEIEKPPCPFMCSICGKEFNNKYLMNSHEKAHSGIKERCDECGKEFLTKRILKLHIQSVHLKWRRIECHFENCKAILCSKAILQRHIARKHGIVKNPYPCPICGKEFPNSKYHLDRHLKAHENNTAKEYSKPAA